MTPLAPGLADGVWSTRRPAFAFIAIGVLAVSAIPLALAGPSLVPAAAGAQPRWLLGPYGSGVGLDGRTFFVLFVVAFLAYLGIVATAHTVSLRMLWGAIGAATVLFALAPPLISQDVLSYISYARLDVNYGLNPYEFVPADAPNDPVLPFVGWKEATSAYGPLFTLGSYPAGVVSIPLALWMFKVVAAASVLGLAALSARIADRRNINPARAAALVGLNPLVLVHVVGGAHNDGLMILVVIGGLALLLAGAEVASGAALITAAAIKASAAFAVPFALLGSRRRLSFIAGAAAAAAVTSTLAFAAFGFSAFESIGLVGQNQAATSRYSLPATMSRLFGIDVEPVRYGALVIYGLVLLHLLVWTVRRADWIRAAGWAGLGLLLATSWLLPWYVIWVLPFAAITEDRWLRVATLALCAFQLINRVPV